MGACVEGLAAEELAAADVAQRDARLSASRPKCAVVASKVFRTLPPSIRAAIEANGPVKTVRWVSNVPESVGSMR